MFPRSVCAPPRIRLEQSVDEGTSGVTPSFKPQAHSRIGFGKVRKIPIDDGAGSLGEGETTPRVARPITPRLSCAAAINELIAASELTTNAALLSAPI
ncbi:hypothetical protein HN011_006875 [Eciton burchellii]|nr:hypothetical protein HN011_006875 [Eciton burchellii]